MKTAFQKPLFSSIILSVALLTIGCRAPQASEASERSGAKSLSGDTFKGQKYYLGWGAVANSDPAMMHNEVKYDVLHTSNVFSKDLGGSYEATTAIGQQANSTAIRQNWQQLKAKMKSEDMFVQYSSGHGMRNGLAIGLSWAEMTKNILSMPSKETIVFTMSCYSGNFIDALNQQKSQWQNRQQEGRTLFVMSSSRDDETSSTGPGTDWNQQGPEGSAGSAFGYALWKAFSGEADGYIDGIADGYLTLEEIAGYTKDLTVQNGGHTPQITGVYSPNLVMSRVPQKSFDP